MTTVGATGSPLSSAQEKHLTALDRANLTNQAKASLSRGDHAAYPNDPARPEVVLSLSFQAAAVLAQNGAAIPVTSRGTQSSSVAATYKPTPPIGLNRNISVVEWFYATTSVQEFVAGLSPAQAAAFIAAYDSKTLNIESTAAEPQLDAKDMQAYLDDETVGGAGSTASGSAIGAQGGRHSFVYADPIFGDILISWAAPPTSSTTASAANP